MTQSLANLTIEQSVEFLANRQVGLRYSCAPSLEKFAQNPAAEGAAAGAAAGAAGAGDAPAGDAPAGNTLASLLANPAMRAALWGTAGGGIIGGLAGLRRKKERRNLLRDALTGALAGGVGLGGLSLAYNTLTQRDPTLPEDLPTTTEALKKFNAGFKTPEEAQQALAGKVGKLSPELQGQYKNLYNKMIPKSDGSWTAPALVSEALTSPITGGRGLGKLLGSTMKFDPDAEAHPLWETGGELVGGAAGATVPLAVGNKVLDWSTGTPVDLSRNRLTAVGDAMARKTPAAAGKPSALTEGASNLQEMWKRHFSGVDPDVAAKTRSALMSGADDVSVNRLSNLLLGQDVDVDGTVFKAKDMAPTRQATLDFLKEVRDTERTFTDPAKTGKPWAGIQVPDARLGHLGSAVQRGKVPGLRSHMGMNPQFRSDIPLAPKNLPAMRPPRLKPGLGRNLGIFGPLAALGYGFWHDKNTQDRDFAESMNPFESKGDSK